MAILAEPVLDFIAGLLGGCAGLVFGHPFDTMKVRQQTYTKMSHNMLQTMRATFIHDGLVGFYKGMAFPLVSVGVLNSIFFGVYGNTIRKVTEYRYGDKNAKASYLDVFLVGGMAGGIQAFPACTIELVKVKLQAQSNGRPGSSLTSRYRGPISSVLFLIHKDHGMNGIVHGVMQPQKSIGPHQPMSAGKMVPQMYRGPMQCLSSIYKKNGIRGCFHGLNATIIREVPGFSIYMVSYTYMCDKMKQDDAENPGVGAMLVAGGLAGVFSWIGNIPFDVIKSRLQADNLSNPRYRNYWECVRKSYRDDGYRVFWRGLPVTCIRAFPVNAVTFTVYSTSLVAMQRHFNKYPLDEDGY